MLPIRCLCFFISIVILNTGINALDLCSISENNSTDIDSYIWKNSTTTNCGCHDCIRKCCKPGYHRVLGTKLCVQNKTEYSFSVPVYTNEDEFVKDVTDIRSFVVGPIFCEYFDLNYPSEEFYVQIDGTVWVPMYNRYFHNGRYCVDEGNGFTPLLCLPLEPVTPNTVGMYNLS